MKSNEKLLNNLAKIPNLKNLEESAKKHQDIYLIKSEIERGIQSVILISLYDEFGRHLYFDKNGISLREKIDDQLEPAVPQDHLILFFTEIKPKMMLERLNSMTNPEDFWELAESYNLTRVHLEGKGANAFYLVYGSGEYEPDPDFWHFFFDDQGNKITKEEYEMCYDKNHEFKFYLVYNKMADKEISTH